jgi:transglutaminase-like putative cysteine protease
MILHIDHRTVYTYPHPVLLGSHRLMLRPRESRDIRLLSMDIATNPPAAYTWAHDVFGNTVTTVSFVQPVANLTIESHVVLDHSSDPWPIFGIAASAISSPFAYSQDEQLDLGVLLVPQYQDPERRLAHWARGFVRGDITDTLSLLKDLNAAISAWISYQSREDEGTQSPLETLARGWGSCRDIAVLFIESARWLGFAARIVSGYLFNPDAVGTVLTGSPGAGSTHAWAEIYLPGAGWIAFDPTNRTVGNSTLIPVAVARNVKQVVPISGTFTGSPGDVVTLDVAVAVRATSRPVDPDSISGRTTQTRRSTEWTSEPASDRPLG